MLDRLIEFFLSILDLFRFWRVIDEYEEGVVLRFGKHHRNLEKGFHFIYPLGVEDVLSENVALEAADLGQQTLVTADDCTVLVGSYVTYKIKHVQKFILEVEDANSVLVNSVCGVIGEEVRAHTWEEVRKESFLKSVYAESRQKAFKWGIELVELQFTDLSRAKTLRVITE